MASDLTRTLPGDRRGGRIAGAAQFNGGPLALDVAEDLQLGNSTTRDVQDDVDAGVVRTLAGGPDCAVVGTVLA